MASQQRSTQILSTTLKKTTKLLDNTPIKEYYTKFYKNQEKILHSISIDYPEKDTINPYSIIDDNQVENGFVAAIQQAYNHHQHLRISPDDVWLAIAQGVSNHINNNAERFRYYFVKHEGQKEICIFAGDILSTENNQLKGDWPVAINRLTTKVDENVTKVDLSKTLEYIGFVLSFVAGFLGAQQESFGEGDETEVIVSPVIGWLVVDQIKD
ncbi:hypothetical protein G9A89_011546 [Geosiphon pyriformis]|nr:hypothetical protein G9A89_011546 [Geosiphon pyriformis]